MNSRTKSVVVVSSTCLVALLLLGGVVSKGAPADANASADNNVYKHLAVYSEVLSRIKSEYVEEPDMNSVTLGALNGLLESIKGIATRDMPLAYANLLLKGQPGSTVDLSVLRRKPEPQKLTMTRAIVTPPAVDSKMLPESIGYVKVATMGYSRIKEVATAV